MTGTGIRFAAVYGAIVFVCAPQFAWGYINGMAPGESRGDYEQRRRREQFRNFNAQQQRLASALAPLNEAIGRNPQDAVAYYQRAKVFAEFKDPRAYDDYSSAIRWQPNFAHAYYRRSFYKREPGKPSADLERAIALEPDSPAVVAEMGQHCIAIAMHLQRENPGQAETFRRLAVEHAEQACRLTDNQSPECQVILAIALSFQKQFSEAIECLERAKQLGLPFVDSSIASCRSGTPFFRHFNTLVLPWTKKSATPS